MRRPAKPTPGKPAPRQRWDTAGTARASVRLLRSGAQYALRNVSCMVSRRETQHARQPLSLVRQPLQSLVSVGSRRKAPFIRSCSFCLYRLRRAVKISFLLFPRQKKTPGWGLGEEFFGIAFSFPSNQHAGTQARALPNQVLKGEGIQHGHQLAPVGDIAGLEVGA